MIEFLANIFGYPETTEVFIYGSLSFLVINAILATELIARTQTRRRTIPTFQVRGR